MGYRLFKYSKDTGITVQPEPAFPAMWRIHWADGSVSGMCNLSRAKDDARQSVHAGKTYWKVDTLQTAVEGPPTAESEPRPQDSGQPKNASGAPRGSIWSAFRRSTT